MVTATLFTAAKIWKQTKCLSIDTCVKKIPQKGMKLCHLQQHGPRGYHISEVRQKKTNI